MVEKEPLIPKHGGYRKLKSFQVAQLVYDVTVRFSELYVDRFSRTRDQMVQAARSGVQNIAEGSQASATSRKTELKLTNVARASLEELLIDFQDFSRLRDLKEWNKHHPYARRLTELNRLTDANYGTFRKGIEHENPEICVNVIVGLIKVTCYLLDRQIRRLEKDFMEHGGMRERMMQARLSERNRQKGPK